MIEGVRLYVPRDRGAVRRIAFETGYMGDPIGWQWGDPESFNDLVTAYYTDELPDSLWVAERGGRVVGYLTGCLESGAARIAMRTRAQRLFLSGGLFRPGVRGFFSRMLLDVVCDRAIGDEALLDERWPAHLHINLLAEARGSGLGRRLMEGFLCQARSAGAAGVHLGTFAENENGQAFFARMGFAPHGEPFRVPGFRTRSGERMHSRWMTLALDRGSSVPT